MLKVHIRWFAFWWKFSEMNLFYYICHWFTNLVPFQNNLAIVHIFTRSLFCINRVSSHKNMEREGNIHNSTFTLVWFNFKSSYADFRSIWKHIASTVRYSTITMGSLFHLQPRLTKFYLKKRSRFFFEKSYLFIRIQWISLGHFRITTNRKILILRSLVRVEDKLNFGGSSKL